MYGIYIGRFQPLHAGHMKVIRKIILDDLKPIVCIGSSLTRNEENPLTYLERQAIIHMAFGEQINTLPLQDNDCNSEWVSHLLSQLESVGIERKDCCVYYHYKDGDFDLRDILGDLFKFKLINSNFYKISATKIRNNFNKYSWGLSSDVARHLRKKGWGQ